MTSETFSRLVDLLKQAITPETYARHKRELEDLEHTIAVESMGAQDSEAHHG